MRVVLAVLGCAALAACDASAYRLGTVTIGGPPLITGHSPPDTAANTQPQPRNSLPPGAEGIGNSGPNSRFPNAASVTVDSPI